MAARASSSTILLILAMMLMPPCKADYFCGINNACYMIPSGCTYGNCDFEVVWSQQANSTKYDFKIAARATGWVAIAITHDKKMGDDDVYMCSVNETGTGSKFEHRFNRGRANIAGSGVGVVNTELTTKNGVVSCRFERDLSVTNNGVTFNLTTDWYMFFGKGPLVSGNPVQHEKIPMVTKQKVDFSLLPIISTDDLEDPHVEDDNGATAHRAGLLLVTCSIMAILTGTQM
ncbi:DOMON domain-containing protein FRRS1L-like [Acanthaster planci]|uniref:DOMON domain-containing protein FRRS1L-like n=1 Tax=Acanthaster planci TaxID=133434 RepID=A0A8B7Z6W9_ACAPL|nr:DOMON domain-containing protein FRRS1L-like [Acanthaster planci]